GIGREGWRTLSGGQRRDWQRGVEDTEWRPVEGFGREGWRTLSGEGWRTLSGGQWRDWQRGVEDTDGGQWRDWQRGVEDTEWRSVEGLAERGGGH
ncbi:unnamed protein product, partial [Staurois parvus]